MEEKDDIADKGVGYFLAWYSHAIFERNRPATFTYPFWSFFSDLEMFALMVLGWMPRRSW